MRSVIALLCLVAVATAIEIDIAPAALMKASKFGLYSANLEATATSVKWGVCDSVKAYDDAKGISDPDPPVVGKDVKLILNAIMNTDADIHGVDVQVLFTQVGAKAPAVLFQKDYPVDDAKIYHDGDEFKQTITWNIPSFAPKGNYFINVLVHGTDKTTKYVCLTATFDINAWI